jgi:tetratricopeptide (TPR) repeat protein
VSIGGTSELEQALIRALREDPGNADARQKLETFIAEIGAWDRLAALFEDLAEATGSSDLAMTLLAAAGSAKGREGKPTEAIELFTRVLGIRPEDTATRDKLEAVCREHGRWTELAASLEERTNPHQAAKLRPAQAVPILRELATLYTDRLDKARDAVECLERVRALAPRDREALERLIPLYEGLGRWKLAVEGLTALSQLSEGTEQAKAALVRAAEIQRNELGVLERAVETYRLIATRWPRDEAALATFEELLEKTAQWAELCDLLKKRLSTTTDPAARVALLKRRAAILLDKLDRADEAASCLRIAASGHEDAGPDDQFLEALTRAGRHRELSAALHNRVTAMAQRPAEEVVPVLLRLARLQLTELKDSKAALKTLESLLERAPGHAEALALRLELARTNSSPRDYAEMLLKRADEGDVTARVASLVEAATVFRDRVRDPATAREALRRAHELDPADASAARALARLIPDAEAGVAMKILEESLPSARDDDRVELLLELAALARRAGPTHVAEQRLEEVLEARPDHLVAVRAMTELLLGEERHLELITFVRESLGHLGDAPKDVQVELLRVIASAYEAMGEDEKAHANLLEADRLRRNDLLTKLALGANRLRRGQAREAALVLSGIENHPDAPQHGAAVAEGLCLAADAEAQARRTPRAPERYEAALRLDPSCARALHALAEIEMARGNGARAVELLEREAAIRQDPEDQRELFEALGDLVLQTSEDDARAVVLYERAVAAPAPLEAEHEPLLRKLYGCQQELGNHPGAALTAERLAELAESSSARWLEAAAAWSAAGDAARARASAERALALDPMSEEVVWVASAHQLEAGDHEAAAATLGRALASWGAVERGAEARRRRGELWRRLGDARRLRGDARGATVAYDRSLEADPSGTGARRGLLAMTDDPARRLELLGALVEADPSAEDALALARMLAAADPVGARVTYELAAQLGAPLDGGDRGRLAQHDNSGLSATETYRSTLDDGDRAALIADPDDEPLAAILAAAWEASSLLWPDPARALEALEVKDAERARATSRGAAAAIYPQVAKALRGPLAVVYLTTDLRYPDVAVVCAAPPIVLFGPRLKNPTLLDPRTNARMRFMIGRAVEQARPERVAATGTPPAVFARLVAGLVRAFGRGKTLAVADVPEDKIDAEAQRLKKTLSVAVRMRLEELLAAAAIDRLDPEAYRAACERAADRAGLIACGSLDAAIGWGQGAGEARHLVELAAKARYRALIARL